MLFRSDQTDRFVGEVRGGMHTDAYNDWKIFTIESWQDVSKCQQGGHRLYRHHHKLCLQGCLDPSGKQLEGGAKIKPKNKCQPYKSARLSNKSKTWEVETDRFQKQLKDRWEQNGKNIIQRKRLLKD